MWFVESSSTTNCLWGLRLRDALRPPASPTGLLLAAGGGGGDLTKRWRRLMGFWRWWWKFKSYWKQSKEEEEEEKKVEKEEDYEEEEEEEKEEQERPEAAADPGLTGFLAAVATITIHYDLLHAITILLELVGMVAGYILSYFVLRRLNLPYVFSGDSNALRGAKH
jgi:Sec-independent protein translocase protein TatA